MSPPESPPTPSVRVSGAPAPPARPAAAPSHRGTAVLVGALALALGVAALDRPAPVPPVDASLRVLPERIATSQAGVVVVPVEIDDRGPAVVVEDVVVRAEPVRQPPAASGVSRVGAASRGGFVVIVQPDCGVLARGTRFHGSVTVELRSGAGARRELVLDLDEDPAVAARLTSLCARPD